MGIREWFGLGGSSKEEVEESARAKAWRKELGELSDVAHRGEEIYALKEALRIGNQAKQYGEDSILDVAYQEARKLIAGSAGSELQRSRPPREYHEFVKKVEDLNPKKIGKLEKTIVVIFSVGILFFIASFIGNLTGHAIVDTSVQNISLYFLFFLVFIGVCYLLVRRKK